MTAVSVPLTFATAASSWRLDLLTTAVVAVVLVGYLWGWRHSAVATAPAVAFVTGAALWWLSASAFLGVYSDVLFWVRALQFVVVLMVAPFLLAVGQPITVLRDVVGAHRLNRLLGTRIAQIAASAAVTSAAVIVTPWLIYLTGWYPALLRSHMLDAVTRLLLVGCGFGYFYARLQVDPVPRRRPQGLSVLISLGETLGDGALGVVMWQGSLIASAHYQALGRSWGPSLRTDQTIGAGVFWILGDVVGLPFLLVLFSRFRTDEMHRATVADAEHDARVAAGTEAEATSLWWESHPELRDRLR